MRLKAPMSFEAWSKALTVWGLRNSLAVDFRGLVGGSGSRS